MLQAGWLYTRVFYVAGGLVIYTCVLCCRRFGYVHVRSMLYSCLMLQASWLFTRVLCCKRAGYVHLCSVLNANWLCTRVMYVAGGLALWTHVFYVAGG